MKNRTIENQEIKIEISTHGAEIIKIENKQTKQDYLWCGDKKYWGRHSPVLFPIVGKVWNGHMRHEGKEYAISQHGFARDREFNALEDAKSAEILKQRKITGGKIAGYVLHSDSESREKLPFDFDLYIIYRLDGNKLEVYWQVENKTEGEIYFQIGAHPAFNYRDYDAEADIQGYLKFDKSGTLSVTKLENGGYASEKKTIIELEENRLAIKRETFAGDALVLEKQVNRVELCDKKGESYIEVEFDAPAVGLWSPAKEEYAPFVCIEPWYGRCDPIGYKGEFKNKPYINKLSRGEIFKSKYRITFK